MCKYHSLIKTIPRYHSLDSASFNFVSKISTYFNAKTFSGVKFSVIVNISCGCQLHEQVNVMYLVGTLQIKYESILLDI